MATTLANTTFPWKVDLSGYGANAKSQAQINALTKATLNDFKVNLTYQVPRGIGTVNTGTDDAPVWEQRYELITRVVGAWSINQDLVDFQNAINGSGAYNPGVAPSTTTIP